MKKAFGWWIVTTFLVSLSSGLGEKAGVLEIHSELVAEVSLRLAEYYAVDCIQIFRSERLPVRRRESIRATWRRLAVLEAAITTGVYSYDRYAERKRAKPRKVSCYRSLKVMSDDEESRRGYARLTKEFSIKDAVWLLFLESLTSDFFRYAKVTFDDVIVIAEVQANDSVLLYETYQINETFPLKILPLGNWTRKEGLVLPQEGLYDRRSDLEGLVLKTTSSENWPATYTKKGKWDGFLIKLWNEIKSRINCTSVFVRSNDSDVGMRMDNGSWNGLLGMAVRGEIDVLVSEIVINKERSHALKFLYPIMKTRFQIYTRHLGYEWQWTSVLKPFNVNVWLAALAWILVGSTFLAFCHNLLVNHGLERLDRQNAFTTLKSFLFVIQAFSQQGHPVTPETYSCRILFLMSYAVSSVLIPSYSASLVSSLAQKTEYRSFNSLQEMVADGTYQLLVKENTAQHAFFVHTADNFLKTAYEKLARGVPEPYKKMNFLDSLNAICHLPKVALMGIEEIIEVQMSGASKPDCTVVPLKHPVSTIYLTMATSKTSPYWGLINHHLEKLLVTGIVDRLRLQEFPRLDLPKNTPQEEVSLRQLAAAFIFFGFFVAISVFVLFLEVHLRRQEIAKINRKRKMRQLHQNKTLECELKSYRSKIRSLSLSFSQSISTK